MTLFEKAYEMMKAGFTVDKINQMMQPMQQMQQMQPVQPMPPVQQMQPVQPMQPMQPVQQMPPVQAPALDLSPLIAAQQQQTAALQGMFRSMMGSAEPQHLTAEQALAQVIPGGGK